LQPDEDVVCTITNSVNKGTIIVEKQTNPDGDQTVFPFTGDAAGSISDGQQIVVADLTPGTYTSTENVPGGWVLNNISCDDTNSFGDLGTKTATFNLDPGETVKCTFTNTKYGSIKVIKNVEPDDGSLWNFTLTVGGYIEGSGPLGNGGEYTFSDLPSYTYLLYENEAPKAGYDTSVSCDSGETGTNQVSVNLAPGEDVVCTFINKPKPKLTLEKVVTNNDGGVAQASDWILTATGDASGFSGNGPTIGPNFVNAAVTYILSESGPAGYSASPWSCDGGTQNGSEITLNYGDDVICTITNDDIAPTLTLIKYVTNNNGGTALDIDWTLYATGSERSFSGTTPASDTVKAGITYTLSESGPSGYSASPWSCDGGTQNGNEITLGLDDDVTCTITNDDIAPTLTLVKVIINDDGGNLTESDFQAKIDGSPVPWNLMTSLQS